MKKCVRCEIHLDESCFFKDRRASDGLRSSCKGCEGSEMQVDTDAVHKSQVSVSGSRVTVQMHKLQPFNLEDVASHFSLDTKYHEVVSHVFSERDYVNGLTLYGAKVVYERKTVPQIQVDVVSVVTDAIRSLPALEPSDSPSVADGTGFLLEYGMTDLHVGLHAWGEETGENYDLHIAEDVAKSALNQTIARMPVPFVDQSLCIVGSDALNVDSRHMATYSGTPQDTDGRWTKMVDSAIHIFCNTVLRLLEVSGRVHVLYIQANHDASASYIIAAAVRAHFRDEPRVSFDLAPTYRKYYHWGKCAIGWAHGDKGKESDLPLLMATERPHMWAATTFREFHTGHLHRSAASKKKVTNTDIGFVHRILPSLAAADAWHSQKGYVGPFHSNESYLWDREHGLVSCIYANIPSSEYKITEISAV